MAFGDCDYEIAGGSSKKRAFWCWRQWKAARNSVAARGSKQVRRQLSCISRELNEIILEGLEGHVLDPLRLAIALGRVIALSSRDQLYRSIVVAGPGDWLSLTPRLYDQPHIHSLASVTGRWLGGYTWSAALPENRMRLD